MIDRYAKKLNKVDGKIYVIEEVVTTVGGVYENELDHDNIEVGTINVYTGSKLTGDKVDNVIVSIPADAPWKRLIRILSSAETLYISYETPGDTVEADDINRVQDGIVRTQEGLQAHEEATQAALDQKVDKVAGKGLSSNDYTTAEKSKLAGVAAGAQVNTVTSVAGKTGAVSLAKGDVGLGSVDNTADASKPISTAAQTALDGKVDSARVLSDVPVGAKFTDTVTTVNGKTGAISKADIVALGIPAQDTVVDISGKADKTYVDNKVKTDVPAGAKFTDTVYTHPASHPPSIIAQNSTNRFVTDAEKASWNSKESSGAKTWNDLKGV